MVNRIYYETTDARYNKIELVPTNFRAFISHVKAITIVALANLKSYCTYYKRWLSMSKRFEFI